MKKYFYFIIFAIVLLSSMIISGCKSEGEYYYINYYVNNIRYQTYIQEKDAAFKHKLEEIKLDGYEFDGWYSDIDCKQKFDFNLVINSTTEIFGKLNLINYKINYETNGGVLGESAYETYNIQIDEDLCVPTKEGYVFLGWYDNPQLLGLNITTLFGRTEDINLFAKWEPINYSINYLNTKNSENSNPSMFNIESNEIILSDLEKDGCNFLGWYDNKDYMGERVTCIEAGSVGSRDLYAKWELINYKINYHLDNLGSLEGYYPTSYNIESIFELPTPKLKNNLVFGGWYDNSQLEGMKVTTLNGRTGNVDLYLKILDVEEPTFYLTDSYTVENDGTIKVGGVDITNKELDEQLELLGDRTNWLDAYYEVDAEGKVTVAIPALYATDNSSNINEIIANSTRELYKRGSSSNTLTLVNTKDGEDSAKINEVAYFTFSNEQVGNNVWGADNDNYYVVKYVISDGLGNKTTKTYNLYIREANYLPNEGPQITLDPALTSASVNYGETLTFSKPVVVDKHDGKVYDTTVDTATYYSYTSATEGLVELTDKDVNEDGEYEISVLPTNSETKLYIVTKAKNNYYEETANDGYTVKVAEVKVNYPTLDTTAPEFSALSLSAFNTGLINANKESGTLAEDFTEELNEYGKLTTATTKGAFDQNAVISVPAFSFKDDSESLNMTAIVTYKASETAQAKTVKLSNFTVSSEENDVDPENGKYIHTIQNAQFTASNAGYYYVTYVAKDGGNNISFKTYAIYVNDTVGPRIEVPNASKYNEALRPGEWFNIPSAVAYDNGVESSEVITTKVTGPNGAYELSSDGKSFRPLKTGTYYVTYETTDGAGNPSKSEPYAVEVKAVLDEDRFFIEYSTPDYETEYENVTYQTNSSLITPFVVLIPKASATDLDMQTSVKVAMPKVVDGNNIEKEVVEYVRKDGETDEAYAYMSANYYQFTATTQGVHTVTYSATNEFNISISKTIEIKIGDVDAPELKWKDKSNDLVTTVEVGTNWQFDFDNVIISDSGSDDTLENEGITYTVTMYDPDGTKVEVEDYNYTFDKVGSYKFTIKLTDKAGNTSGDEYKYTIVVNEKEETTNPISNTTGTILIVTSVIVLGGVVVYFVVSGRKMSASTKKKSSKKENKEN